MAARAIVILEADEPALGLVAVVFVGMIEVSSCLLGPTIEPGAHVAKGEELGRFQFGGSTHCVVFQPGAVAEFALDAIPQPRDPAAPVKPVLSRLAVAARR